MSILTKFDCPKCGQPMQAEEDVVSDGVTCVSCGAVFVPAQKSDVYGDNIRRSARVILGFAGIMAVIALFVFIGAIFEWRQDAAGGSGEDSGPVFRAAYWFLKGAICLYALGQLTLIRANTEK